MQIKLQNLSVKFTFRIYIYLFFLCAYKFLVFWITTTLFLFFPFALAGGIFYLFVMLMQFAVNSAISRNGRNEQNTMEQKSNQAPIIIILIISIGFFIIYFLATRWMQGLMVEYFKIPERAYSIVATALDIIAIIISLLITLIKFEFKPLDKLGNNKNASNL